MERLWAPWRMQYIEVADVTVGGCIFCRFPAEQDDRANLILARGQHAFVIFNRYPYNNGHLMVIPYAHVSSPEQLDAAQQADLHTLLYRTLGILRGAFEPHGFNLGMNLGRTAGAGIADHCHYHIVPRWNGDTNFMPVLGDTRVISEGLTETYDKLAPLFAAEES